MKKFIQNDDHFFCEVCGNNVPKLNYSSRDHCNICLSSKHVDVNPGDRLNNCHGILEPVAIEKFKNSFKIIYKCKKCNQFHKNIMANDDNMDVIIRLSKNTTY
jgi:hypothetical protein